MNKSFWNKKRVLITGGHGFLGTHLVKKIQATGCELLTPSSQEFDLRKLADVQAVVKNIDVVIHLAAKVGGIGYNQQVPGEMFYDNLMMGASLLD